MDRTKRLAIGALAYYLVCVLAVTWPGALVANRVEPMILGLPFFFFWYVAWALMMFAGMLALYRLEYGGSR